MPRGPNEPFQCSQLALLLLQLSIPVLEQQYCHSPSCFRETKDQPVNQFPQVIFCVELHLSLPTKANTDTTTPCQDMGTALCCSWVVALLVRPCCPLCRGPILQDVIKAPPVIEESGDCLLWL